jgi:hypothetical protein
MVWTFITPRALFADSCDDCQSLAKLIVILNSIQMPMFIAIVDPHKTPACFTPAILKESGLTPKLGSNRLAQFQPHLLFQLNSRGTAVWTLTRNLFYSFWKSWVAS